MESILNQIDDRFEVIVVDNMSNDGSEKYLKTLEKQGKIKLISARCTRGKGRQIAFENSKGEILIINIDMDTVYKQKLDKVLEVYHCLEKKHSKLVLIFNGGAILSRKLIEEVGGWHDLQRGEDTELFWRLEMAGATFIDTGINLIDQHFLSWKHKGIRYLVYDKYILIRDKMRVGKSMRELFFGSERNGRWRTWYGSLLYIILLIAAKITYRFKECYPTWTKKRDLCTNNSKNI